MQETKLKQIEEMNSPTYGRLQMPEILDKITEFVSSQPDRLY